MTVKYSKNYSPNFSTQKRNSKSIKFIIIHYTGMENEIKAINRLTNVNSKVSCHYFIKKNGSLINMVPDRYVAWHAGISHWKNLKFLNKSSLGIEIQNNGHGKKYKNYTKKQINTLIRICKILIKKFKINKRNVLGHSDISYDRKKDPGEKFPWYLLAKENICIWHNLDLGYLKSLRQKKLSQIQKKQFFSNLKKFGYVLKKESKYNKKLVLAFQRRFRPKLINGIIDQECLHISNKLSRL